MSKYKTLIFDLDDTLIDNTESIRYAFQCVLDQLNLNYCEELFNKWAEYDGEYWHNWESGKMILPEWVKTVKDRIRYLRSTRFINFFEELKLDMNKAVQLNECYCENMGVNIVQIGNSGELLKELSEHYEIMIATNGPKNAAMNKAERAQLSEYVNCVVCSEEVGFSKPMPEFFDHVFKRAMNKDKSSMLLIGDTLTTDILGGMKNGIDTCWLNWKKIPVPEEYHPTMVIYELAELKEKLNSAE